ncbi:hypothetical protein ANCDUO_22322, partial [Ancylostoma duodenale]
MASSNVLVGSTSHRMFVISLKQYGPKDQGRTAVARPSKRSRSYENDKIDKLRAMAEFGLREDDLRDLPSQPRPVRSKAHSMTSTNVNHLYALTDVYHKALQVHGSNEALESHRRPLVAMRKELTDAERMRMRMRAYYALFMSLCFQGASAITAYREVTSKAKRAGISVLNYVRTSADPSLNVVLLEDTAAVSG